MARTSSIQLDQLSAGAALRLVCFPYAGGGTAVYHRWRGTMPPGVGLAAVCLPGRERRIGEPLQDDLHQAACDIATDLEPVLDHPWVALGHSMGAWLAWAVCRELLRRGARPPALVVVSASRPPHEAHAGPLLHELPDAELTQTLVDRFDGIPAAVRDNSSYLQLLLPMLRADLKMMETCRFSDAAPLDAEILALGGTDDSAVSAAQLNGWHRHTTSRFSFRLLPGGHFFLFRGGGSGAASPEGAVAERAERISPAWPLIVAKLNQYANTK